MSQKWNMWKGKQEFSCPSAPRCLYQRVIIVCAFLYSEQFYCALVCLLPPPGPAIFTIGSVPCWFARVL